MRFIFVACSKNRKLYRRDPSFVYRCENLAFSLEEKGHTCQFVHLSAFNPLAPCDIVIFHRPLYSVRLGLTMQLLNTLKKLVVVDVDDLVFDPQFAECSPAHVNGILSLSQVQKRFELGLRAFRLSRFFTVSTSELKSRLEAVIPGAQVFVIPNQVHFSWREIPLMEPTTRKNIAYLPGTKSHDADFASVAVALERFLTSHPDVKLHITGPLDFSLNVPSTQIVYNEKVAFEQHHFSFQNIWLNIAPLAKSPFNDSKSALKVLEAGYWKIPTLCSPNGDTLRFAAAGAIVADGENEWNAALERLYSEPEYYRELQERLCTVFEEVASIEVPLQRFVHHATRERIRLLRRLPAPAALVSFWARRRRNAGEYNTATLSLYRRVWDRGKTPDAFLAYLLFRRDLGFALSANLGKRLASMVDSLHPRKRKKALALLDEFQGTSAHQQMQRKMIESFETYIRSAGENGICVVGNAAKLANAHLGSQIDTHGTVVRFNRCFLDSGPNGDTGYKTDVWVCAPGYTGKGVHAGYVVASGPNWLWRPQALEKFSELQEKGCLITGVPLRVWHTLICQLQSPPSAGILLLGWIIDILGSASPVSVAGFDQSALKAGYYYASRTHQASSRHNWNGEKQLLRQWREAGMNFLEPDSVR